MIMRKSEIDTEPGRYIPGRKGLVMTNREAFNKYLRNEVERMVAYVESMSNQKLVETIRDTQNFRVEAVVGEMLNEFMTDWFGRKPDNWKGYDSWVKFLELDNEGKWE